MRCLSANVKRHGTYWCLLGPLPLILLGSQTQTKGYTTQKDTSNSSKRGHTRSPIITPIEVTLLPHSLHDIKPNVIVDRQVIAQWERQRWERKGPQSGCAVLMRSQNNKGSLCNFNKTLLPIWLEVEAETIMYWKYIRNLYRKGKSY